MSDWISPAAQRRLARERAQIAANGCATCRDGCGHRFNDPGCEHYACLGADAAIADTCRVIPADPSELLARKQS